MPVGKNLNLKRDKVIPDKKKGVKEQKAEGDIKKLDPTQLTVPKPVGQTIIKEDSYSITVTPSKRKKVRKTKVELTGDLGINNIAAIDKHIRPLFDSYDLVDVFLKDVEAYDLTTMQLLYMYTAIHDTEDKAKLIKVITDVSSDFQKLTHTCGFSKFMYQYKA